MSFETSFSPKVVLSKQSEHFPQKPKDLKKRDRIIDGYRWKTLDECSSEIFEKAESLDETSFPPFLTENHTNGQFEYLIKTFKKTGIVFLDNSGQKILAAGFSAPIHLGENLPEGGWEGTVNQIVSDYKDGREPNALVAFSISVSPDARGHMMGSKLLISFQQRAKELGF